MTKNFKTYISSNVIKMIEPLSFTDDFLEWKQNNLIGNVTVEFQTRLILEGNLFFENDEDICLYHLIYPKLQKNETMFEAITIAERQRRKQLFSR